MTAGGKSTDKGTKATYNVNANYGFSDSRQTNFATIGAGTIIVRDTSDELGTGGATDFSGLNRDLSKAQYSTKEGGLQGGFVIDDTTVDFFSDPGAELKNTANQVVTGLNDAKDTVEKTGNKIAYGEFGTDDNPDVERAKLSYQMNQEGIAIPANDLGFEAGQLVKSHDGQIFQIGLDEKGNRTLVNTGVNSNDGYMQMASMFGENTLYGKIISDGADISSRYQAVHNYDKKTGTTWINGVEVTFSPGAKNSKEEIINVSGRLWTNITGAAGDTGILGIHIYAVDYGSSKPHTDGVAVDVTALYTSEGKTVEYRRDYDVKTGTYNKPVADSVITNFENSLIMKQEGTKQVWSPWSMYSTNNDWYFENKVTQYPGVYNTGPAGKTASTELKKYAEDNKVNPIELQRSYQHTNHLHYQVEDKYSIEQQKKPQSSNIKDFDI